jgi:pimeloyl-ACP methyl ester carboxylesterase
MMTYLALTRTKRIAAAVIGSGEVDLEEGIKLRPEMETNVIGELVPGYTTNKVQALRARSAIHWPEKLAKDTPILVLAGTADWRVNPMNSLRMAEKLYQQRHPFRMVMFEGGDHGLSEHRAERDRITVDWFDTYLRDRKPWPSPGSLISATTTTAPSSASFSHRARPIPDAPPVTSAIRFSSSCVGAVNGQPPKNVSIFLRVA